MKFFLGDKYPVNEFKVKFFEFVLFAHKFDLLKMIFPKKFFDERSFDERSRSHLLSVVTNGVLFFSKSQ